MGLQPGEPHMTATAYIEQLERRRREIGMSQAALAKRSGVSLPTVQRILSGHHSTAHFASVLAISNALGIEIEVKSDREFTKEVATEKARRLVGAVQATSGLEGQAVEPHKLSEMIDSAVHSLMAGSRRKLWAE